MAIKYDLTYYVGKSDVPRKLGYAYSMTNAKIRAYDFIMDNVNTKVDVFIHHTDRFNNNKWDAAVRYDRSEKEVLYTIYGRKVGLYPPTYILKKGGKLGKCITDTEGHDPRKVSIYSKNWKW